MNDGSVKIGITGDDSDIKKKLEATEENLDELGNKQEEVQKQTDKTTTKFDELAETINKQSRELKDLKGEYTAAIINFGKGSAEAKSLEDKMSSLNSELSKNKKIYSEAANEAEKLSSSLKETGDSAGEGEKGLGLLDIAAGNLVAGGISSLISGIGNAVSSLVSLAEETREFREDMAKLETAFKDAGHTAESAEKVYEDFYAILGESDRSVEAVNHLAELTDNTEDLSKWSTIAAGVTAKFGDSLPIEGLTEAANETAKVGAVTGPLADALNWAGISEEKFNKQLEKCNSEQARATLITNTLNKEYSAAATEYNTLTAETQKARRATAEMEAAQANLGAKIEPLTTAFTELKARGLQAITPLVGTLAEGMLTLTDNLLNNKSAVELRAEAARNSLETVRSEAEAYRELKVSQFEQSAADLAHIENAKLLYRELEGLVDANGRVTEANKGRAEFILTTLNEALGTELQMTGNQIQQYGTLKTAVEEAIAAKQAEILLANDLAAYTEALENRTAKEQEQAQRLIEISEQRKAVAAAETEYNKYLADYNAMLADAKTEADYRNLTSFAQAVQSKQREMEKEKGSLSKLETAYNENEELLQNYYSDISSYQEAQALIMQGKTEEAIKLLDSRNNAFLDSTKIIGKATEEQKAQLEKQAIATGVNAALMKKRYEEGVEGVTEEMVKTAEEAAETAKTEFEKIGGNIGDSIGTGAEAKKPGLLTKIRNIVSAMKKAAEEEAEIHSPSKVFSYIGEMIGEGLAVGVEKKETRAERAVKDIVKTLEKQFDDLKRLEENYANDTKKIQEKLYADIEKAENDYLTSLNNRKNSIRDSLGLFDIAEKGEAVKGSDLTKALSSQVNLLEQYDNALSTLAGRNANASFIEEISQLGVDYLPQLEAINKMTDEELEKYIELWEEKNALASEAATKALAGERERTTDEIANLRKDAEKEAEKLLTEFNKNSLELIQQIADGMKQAGFTGIESLGKTVQGFVDAGKDLMDGVSEGMLSRQSHVIQNAVDVVRAAINGIKKEAGIHSPSAVTRDEVGKNLALGISEGWHSKLSNLKNVMAIDTAGLIERLRATVSAENAYYGRSAGVSDNGFTDLARAVGIQTAGINSLANEYRGGTGRMRPIILQIDGRELGRTVVDVGSAETVRMGVKVK